MLLSIVLICILSLQLNKCLSYQRKLLVFVTLLLYFIISMVDLQWLIHVEHMALHYSDPTNYYNSIIGLDFTEVLQIESSNTFYYIINWIYYKIWNTPYAVSFFVKINNILIFFTAYLLLTRYLKSISYVDLILLFNPYAIMTLLRNVRDAYIILFISIILIGLNLIPRNRIKTIWMFLAIVLLSITRIILLFPLAIIAWHKYKGIFSRKTRIAVYLLLIIFIIIYHEPIFNIIANQMVSAIIDYGEDPEPFLPLLSGSLDLMTIKLALTRVLKAVIVFLFTPHPYNFIHNWLINMNENGSAGIYTGFDNILISIGTIYMYIFTIPLLIASLFDIKLYNKYILIFSILFVLLYTVFYLGNTDIRNKNTALFFILIGIICNGGKPVIKPQYFIVTSIVFLLIYFFGN